MPPVKGPPRTPTKRTVSKPSDVKKRVPLTLAEIKLLEQAKLKQEREIKESQKKADEEARLKKQRERELAIEKKYSPFLNLIKKNRLPNSRNISNFEKLYNQLSSREKKELSRLLASKMLDYPDFNDVVDFFGIIDIFEFCKQLQKDNHLISFFKWGHDYRVGFAKRIRNNAESFGYFLGIDENNFGAFMNLFKDSLSDFVNALEHSYTDFLAGLKKAKLLDAFFEAIPVHDREYYQMSYEMRKKFENDYAVAYEYVRTYWGTRNQELGNWFFRSLEPVLQKREVSEYERKKIYIKIDELVRNKVKVREQKNLSGWIGDLLVTVIKPVINLLREADPRTRKQITIEYVLERLDLESDKWVLKNREHLVLELSPAQEKIIEQDVTRFMKYTIKVKSKRIQDLLIEISRKVVAKGSGDLELTLRNLDTFVKLRINPKNKKDRAKLIYDAFSRILPEIEHLGETITIDDRNYVVSGSYWNDYLFYIEDSWVVGNEDLIEQREVERADNVLVNYSFTHVALELIKRKREKVINSLESDLLKGDYKIFVNKFKRMDVGDKFRALTKIFDLNNELLIKRLARALAPDILQYVNELGNLFVGFIRENKRKFFLFRSECPIEVQNTLIDIVNEGSPGRREQTPVVTNLLSYEPSNDNRKNHLFNELRRLLEEEIPNANYRIIDSAGLLEMIRESLSLQNLEDVHTISQKIGLIIRDFPFIDHYRRPAMILLMHLLTNPLVTKTSEKINLILDNILNRLRFYQHGDDVKRDYTNLLLDWLSIYSREFGGVASRLQTFDLEDRNGIVRRLMGKLKIPAEFELIPRVNLGTRIEEIVTIILNPTNNLRKNDKQMVLLKIEEYLDAIPSNVERIALRDFFSVVYYALRRNLNPQNIEEKVNNFDAAFRENIDSYRTFTSIEEILRRIREPPRQLDLVRDSLAICHRINDELFSLLQGNFPNAKEAMLQFLHEMLNKIQTPNRQKDFFDLVYFIKIYFSNVSPNILIDISDGSLSSTVSNARKNLPRRNIDSFDVDSFLFSINDFVHELRSRQQYTSKSLTMAFRSSIADHNRQQFEARMLDASVSPSRQRRELTIKDNAKEIIDKIMSSLFYDLDRGYRIQISALLVTFAQKMNFSSNAEDWFLNFAHGLRDLIDWNNLTLDEFNSRINSFRALPNITSSEELIQAFGVILLGRSLEDPYNINSYRHLLDRSDSEVMAWKENMLSTEQKPLEVIKSVSYKQEKASEKYQKEQRQYLDSLEGSSVRDEISLELQEIMSNLYRELNVNHSTIQMEISTLVYLLLNKGLDLGQVRRIARFIKNVIAPRLKRVHNDSERSELFAQMFYDIYYYTKRLPDAYKFNVSYYFDVVQNYLTNYMDLFPGLFSTRQNQTSSTQTQRPTSETVSSSTGVQTRRGVVSTQDGDALAEGVGDALDRLTKDPLELEAEELWKDSAKVTRDHIGIIVEILKKLDANIRTSNRDREISMIKNRLKSILDSFKGSHLTEYQISQVLRFILREFDSMHRETAEVSGTMTKIQQEVSRILENKPKEKKSTPVRLETHRFDTLDFDDAESVEGKNDLGNERIIDLEDIDASSEIEETSADRFRMLDLDGAVAKDDYIDSAKIELEKFLGTKQKYTEVQKLLTALDIEKKNFKVFNDFLIVLNRIPRQLIPKILTLIVKLSNNLRKPKELIELAMSLPYKGKYDTYLFLYSSLYLVANKVNSFNLFIGLKPLIEFFANDFRSFIRFVRFAIVLAKQNPQYVSKRFAELRPIIKSLNETGNKLEDLKRVFVTPPDRNGEQQFKMLDLD